MATVISCKVKISSLLILCFLINFTKHLFMPMCVCAGRVSPRVSKDSTFQKHISLPVAVALLVRSSTQVVQIQRNASLRYL